MIPLKAELNTYIDKAIYVWGGQGENVCQQTIKKDGQNILDPEGWITKKETSSYNAGRAINKYRQRIAEGVNPVIAVDCSGLVVEVLRHFSIIKPKADYNTRGLYALCKKLKREDLKYGDLVFYSKTGDPADISHVGFYVDDNKVCESRGRDDGVVVTDFDDNPKNWEHTWNLFGRIEKLVPYTQDMPEDPISFIVTKPVSEGEPYRYMQMALSLAGYTDNNDAPLVVDRIWGNKSRQAWDKMVADNLGGVSVTSIVHIDGIGDITLEE